MLEADLSSLFFQPIDANTLDAGAGRETSFHMEEEEEEHGEKGEWG